ncbi:hypothetical protein BGX31_010259 [Mortierella sp. GBA43]|nr:hypothetical protein BGX31_010259 [Mortierella sp. GBA43]
MNVASVNDPFLQAFRIHPSTTYSDTIYIPTRLDNRTGQRVIHWDDIQQRFDMPRALMNGNERVQFLNGVDLNDHLPLRIAHHPGLVLEVVLSNSVDDNQSIFSSTLIEGSDMSGVFQSLSADNRDFSFSVEPAYSSTDHSEQHDTSFWSNVDAHDERAEMNSILQRLLEHNEDELTSLRQDIEMKEEYTERRLVGIQNRVQLVLGQRFELHEDPVPLFIVLPRSEVVDARNADHFRLHFLCEGGSHTMTSERTGYEIHQPEEFFRKYGSYILTVMYMVKHGFVAAGIIEPLLVSSRANVSSSGHLMLDRLMDDTIRFLKDIEGSNCVLGRAELKELKSHLRVSGESQTLGNLYRMVTPENHVKWVCVHHYRSKYPEQLTQLRCVAKACGGVFVEAMSKIVIEIDSNTVAQHFYDAISRLRGIQELVITLKWDATMDELQNLCDAVTTACVVCLTIDGTNFSGWRDLVHRDCRFDSILQLPWNGRIQSLRLIHFEQFFSRVKNSLIKGRAPALRVLSIDGKVPFSPHVSILSLILDNYPALSELDLHLDQKYRTQWTVKSIVGKLSRLDLLKVDYELFSVKATISKSTIQGASMKLKRLNDLTSEDLEFVQEGCLRQLVVESTPQEPDEDRLTDILEKNPGLQNMTIGCHTQRSFTLLNLVISTRQKVVKDGVHCSECIFELSQEQLVPWDDWRPLDRYDHISAKLTFHKNSSLYSMSTRVIMHNSHGLFEAFAPQVVMDVILKYGWSLEHLRAPSSFSNRHAQMLDVTTDQHGSQLTSLHLDTTGLDQQGRDCIGRVVGRSKALDSPGMRKWTRTFLIKVEGWDDE